MNPKFRNLITSSLFGALVSGFLIVGLPLYLRELNFDISQIGYMFGIAIIFYAIISFYSGVKSESRGRRKFGGLAILGAMVASLLFGVLPALSFSIAALVFIVGKFLYELSDSVIQNIYKIRVVDLSDKKKMSSGFAWLFLFYSLGFGSGMIFGGLILKILTLQQIFFIMPTISLISLLFYIGSGDIKKKKKNRKVFSASNFLNTSKLFKIVLLLLVLLQIALFLVDYFALPLFQKEVLGMKDSQILILIGSAWLVYALFVLIAGKTYDKYGNKSFMISLLLLAVASVALVFMKNILVFSIMLIINFILFAFTDTAMFGLAGLMSKKDAGMLMSLFQFFTFLSLGIIVLFFGKLVDIFGFEFIFVVKASMQIIGIFLLVYIDRKINKFKNQFSQ